MTAGVYMPAEWARHAATWLTWPHCEETWPGRLDAVVPAYVAMIRALAEGEVVYVNTLSEEHRRSVQALLEAAQITTGDAARVRLPVIPTDDEWIRDYGAFFVVASDGLIATDWVFNAWGGKYDRTKLNNLVPAAMASTLGVPRAEYAMVLEGGAIDVNGEGACLTTESCLLNPNRNPELSRREIEERLAEGLGIHDVIWLGEGVEGDDTDGHIDDLARFVAPRTVVTAVETDGGDVNFAPLQENLRRLRAHRLRDGSRLEVIELPMPSPLYFEGQRLPASYINFYIGNEVVLLPVFRVREDEQAIGRLEKCFPTRRIVPIDARELVWGFGSCHCLTQQVPAV